MFDSHDPAGSYGHRVHIYAAERAKRIMPMTVLLLSVYHGEDGADPVLALIVLLLAVVS
jgi:hypothetical protein